MGFLDKIFDKHDDKNRKPKADFSDVQSGSSSTAPPGQAPLADAPLGTPGTGLGRTYTVKAGDSLSKIAKREYGDAQQWHKIYEANRDKIKDPDLIYPGQTFTLP